MTAYFLTQASFQIHQILLTFLNFHYVRIFWFIYSSVTFAINWFLHCFSHWDKIRTSNCECFSKAMPKVTQFTIQFFLTMLYNNPISLRNLQASHICIQTLIKEQALQPLWGLFVNWVSQWYPLIYLIAWELIVWYKFLIIKSIQWFSLFMPHLVKNIIESPCDLGPQRH